MLFLTANWTRSTVPLNPISSITRYLWKATVRGFKLSTSPASFIDLPSAKSLDHLALTRREKLGVLPLTRIAHERLLHPTGDLLRYVESSLQRFLSRVKQFRTRGTLQQIGGRPGLHRLGRKIGILVHG